ncbi:MAG: hypothetical protein M1834_003142 [Cirrosporium novae-zelandiae]|nr:MAG: hypothetical protein M1834_003142 [Cirrosporium novae-zelandiae]
MNSLNLYILSFNCARTLINPQAFSAHIFDALPKNGSPAPEILVFALQEIAPIAYSFLGGSYLVPYLDSFEDAVGRAASKLGDQNYKLINWSNIGMTALMVFIREDVTSQLQFLQTAGTGVGFLKMGNKGAVGARMGYLTEAGEVIELTFVAAHLAPMEEGLRGRNQDWADIVRNLVFSSTDNTADKSIEERGENEQEEEHPLLNAQEQFEESKGVYRASSYLFLAGDLNYRTSNFGPSPEDHLTYPRPLDAPENPEHYSELFLKDQLTREIKAGNTCHGLIEPPINFPPTYKYKSNGDWARHRWPSWCDRILFLDIPEWVKNTDPTARIDVHNYIALPQFKTSDHRPVAMSLSLPLKSIAPPEDLSNGSDPRLSPPFQIDPNWNSTRCTARRREFVIGVLSYLGLTWEGNGILLGTFLAALGGWLIIQSMSTHPDSNTVPPQT